MDAAPRDDTSERLGRQEAQYAFPYHHIAHFDAAGSAARARVLPWAVEYLVYLKRCADLVAEAQPASVLDVGCGDGRFLGLLEGPFERRAGADMSERAIAFARAFHPDFEFHAGDAADVPGTFDVVTAIEVLEHVPDEHVPRFLQTLAAKARPGGTVVICVPTTVVPVSAKHFRHYDEERLAREIAASGAPLECVATERVMRKTRRLDWYKRLTHNRLWFWEVWPLRRRVWDHAWNVARHADTTNGRHLVAVLRRAK